MPGEGGGGGDFRVQDAGRKSLKESPRCTKILFCRRGLNFFLP